MDNPFDRRELLLHIGDMLEVLSCSAKTGRPDASVAQLARQQEALQEFEFLRTLAPKMTVAEFGARVASAYFLWPKELLESDLNRVALAWQFPHGACDEQFFALNTLVPHRELPSTQHLVS
jgi:hypothetical protein